MRVTMGIAERFYADIFRPMHLGFLAEAYACIGERERARELIDEAITRAAKTSERYFEAELHRMRGELLLEQDKTAAEASFDRALSIARRQNAKSWELRAAVNLARLWRDRGDSDRARDLLAPIYSWFTEGFDTPDLLAARALLDELHRDRDAGIGALGRDHRPR
jgi:predicted ATPase